MNLQRARVGAQPSLICVDLPTEQVALRLKDPAASRTLRRIAAIMDLGRAAGWRVTHAYGPREPQAFVGYPRLVQADHRISDPDVRRSIAAVTPLADEPVFRRIEFSALFSPHRGGALESCSRAELHLIGAVFTATGLAALLSATEFGWSPIVLEDACFAPDEPAEEPYDNVRLTRALFQPLAQIENSELVFADPGEKITPFPRARRPWSTSP